MRPLADEYERDDGSWWVVLRGLPSEPAAAVSPALALRIAAATERRGEKAVAEQVRAAARRAMSAPRRC